MNDKSNKKFWNKFAKLYAPFMKKDKGVYDNVCEYIRPYLNLLAVQVSYHLIFQNMLKIGLGQIFRNR